MILNYYFQIIKKKAFFLNLEVIKNNSVNLDLQNIGKLFYKIYSVVSRESKLETITRIA